VYQGWRKGGQEVEVWEDFLGLSWGFVRDKGKCLENERKILRAGKGNDSNPVFLGIKNCKMLIFD
jgi:hypothetical protein